MPLGILTHWSLGTEVALESDKMWPLWLMWLHILTGSGLTDHERGLAFNSMCPGASDSRRPWSVVMKYVIRPYAPQTQPLCSHL